MDGKRPRPVLGRSGMALGCAALVLGLLSAACAGTDGAALRTESAMALHVAALDAHSRGDAVRSQRLLEKACLLGHEPSCQDVWLRIDMEVEPEAGQSLASLEGTARHVAEATDGIFFVHDEGRIVTARVYCPLASEGELELVLAELRGSGDDAQPDTRVR